MGKGTRKRKSTQDEPGCNLLGSSVTNRVLWSVMLSRVYSGKKLGNKPFLKLIDHLATQLSGAFYNGFDLARESKKIYMVPIAMKGDWPALAKVGTLLRHFGRQVKSGNGGGHGICHTVPSRPAILRELAWCELGKHVQNAQWLSTTMGAWARTLGGGPDPRWIQGRILSLRHFPCIAQRIDGRQWRPMRLCFGFFLGSFSVGPL